MNIRKRNRNPKGLVISKRINFFQFSYYHYCYYYKNHKLFEYHKEYRDSKACENTPIEK